MSVDKFGRHSRKSRQGARGPSGHGFVLTSDGDFDIGNKKLRRVSDPTDSKDAVTMQYIDNLIELIASEQENIKKIINKAVFDKIEIDNKFTEINTKLEDLEKLQNSRPDNY